MTEALDQYASSGQDEFTTKTWPMMKGLLEDLQRAVADLKQYSPPTQGEIYEFIKSEAGQANFTIKAAYEKMKELQETINQLREKAYSEARTLMAPESLPEEKLTELRGGFAKKRALVTGQLDAAKTYAELMGKTELLELYKSVDVPQFARGLGGASAPSESQAVREWAKAQGLKVSDKGKISDEIWAAYRKAHS